MSRYQKKPLERKKEIIQVACHLFQQKGYEYVTMQDIIEHVGIAKGTIYHYFRSKKELLEAVINSLVEENLATMQLLLEETKGNAIQKIEMLVRKGNLAAEQPEMLSYLHKPGNEALHVRLLAEMLVKQASMYAKLIQQGCEEGLFQTDHPLECAEFILTAVQFLTDRGIYPWLEEDLERRLSAFPKLLERQLMAPSGSFQFMFSQ